MAGKRRCMVRDLASLLAGLRRRDETLGTGLRANDAGPRTRAPGASSD
jgi:hypothetical protein